MSQLPFDQAGSLRIGTVDFVSPDDIKVVLDTEAPDSVALNAGAPNAFPRVNGYLLVPVDEGYLVGQVEWITVEHSPFPKRRGMRDFGLVDLPYPLRKLRLNPLGSLRSQTGDGEFRFQRGADALPSVGSAALLPTRNQLRAIVESGDQKVVRIGTSPLSGDAGVGVNPDRLFGRHLAVLGNTGSGKSCSVAGLIRWCLEESKRISGCPPNARFIVLDPNGEYSRAFETEGVARARVFKVEPGDSGSQLRVPLWLWNSAEWSSFTLASTRTQRPTLLQALRYARDGQTEPVEDPGHGMRRFLRTIMSIITIERNNGSPWAQFPRAKSFREKLETWKSSLEPDLGKFEGNREEGLRNLIDTMEGLCIPRRVPYAPQEFTVQEIEVLLSAVGEAHHAFGGSIEDFAPLDVDAPLPFDGEAFLRNVEATAEMLNVSEYVETLLIRIRSLLSNGQMGPILESTADTTLVQWLSEYIGVAGKDECCVTVIDLSLVPSEIVHIVTAVIARVIFEALQRYVKINGRSLPTVLVMEEAHTFIRRYREDMENQDAATVCCQVFERVAREGRKFGLGLVLSSQRPSELSPAVLSQCNTFLLHRISNDRDQELVRRLVPDNFRGFLRELPSLPSQTAILLGWASEMPVLVRMNDLPREQQPRSEDPAFWGVWTGTEHRSTDWKAVAYEWQGRTVDGQNDKGMQEADIEDLIQDATGGEGSPGTLSVHNLDSSVG